MDLYGGANSAINSVSLAENSFGHRDKLLTFQMYASSPDFAPPYPEEGFSFLDGCVPTFSFAKRREKVS